jgi:arginine/lysine/ornithine decarboxylase
MTAGGGGQAEEQQQEPLVPAWRVARCLQALQSSSPSYLLMASLDAARALAFAEEDEEEQHPSWRRALGGADALRQGLVPTGAHNRRSVEGLADQFVMLNRAKLPPEELEQAKMAMRGMMRMLAGEEG